MEERPVEKGDKEELEQVGRELRAQVGGEFRLVAEEARFQIAEALAIAAVAVILLAAVLAIAEVLGFDTIDWIGQQFGANGG